MRLDVDSELIMQPDHIQVASQQVMGFGKTDQEKYQSGDHLHSRLTSIFPSHVWQPRLKFEGLMILVLVGGPSPSFASKLLADLG